MLIKKLIILTLCTAILMSTIGCVKINNDKSTEISKTTESNDTSSDVNNNENSSNSDEDDLVDDTKVVIEEYSASENDSSKEDFSEPSTDLSSGEIDFIQSKMSEKDATTLVTSLKFFTDRTSTYALVREDELHMCSAGSKLGYIMNVRSYGEVTDAVMEAVFIDADSKKVYLVDWIDTGLVDLTNPIN